MVESEHDAGPPLPTHFCSLTSHWHLTSGPNQQGSDRRWDNDGNTGVDSERGDERKVQIYLCRIAVFARDLLERAKIDPSVVRDDDRGNTSICGLSHRNAQAEPL